MMVDEIQLIAQIEIVKLMLIVLLSFIIFNWFAGLFSKSKSK